MYEAGNGRETGSPSEPIICSLKGTVNEGFTVHKIIFVKIWVRSSDLS